ncbi:hypothetical protein DSO57_1002668 [Entomophthora muscae]|uniref:Uncharacterized protein n=1 Tax=Entomophthora muscae TaxID=34485 RepID=A0ACC2TJG8_9FUNG|nr:hypothetical protein DSO57_1002668 [Entomophthora muscae]
MNILDSQFGAIDFKGQYVSIRLFQSITIISGIISFIIGFYRQNLIELLGIYGAGIILGLLPNYLTKITVPPWPYLNSAPVPWLSSLSPPKPSASSTTDASTQEKKES